MNSKDLILDRLSLMSDKAELIQKNSSNRIKSFELKDSKYFNLIKFRVELLKSRYSNEFIDDEDIEEQSFNNLLILHLRRVYLNDNLYSIVIKFIKEDNKNLLIFIELMSKIVYDDSGRECFI